MLTVSLEGIEDLERDWSDAQRELSEGLRRGVRMGVDEGATEARTRHNFKSRTGEADRHTRGRMLGETHGAAVGEIMCDVLYASFLSDGTKPHEIRPKEGHGFTGPLQRGQSRRKSNDIGTHRVSLRWYDDPSSLSGVHFARVVRHPGTKPDPFMGLAFLKAERVVIREVDVAVERAIKIMER